MYHVSPKLGLQVLKPHIPYVDNESLTPRVCAAPTLDGCVDALGDLEYNVTYYVYEILTTPDVSNAQVAKLVPDAAFSGEVWYLKDVKCTCLGEVFSVLWGEMQ